MAGEEPYRRFPGQREKHPRDSFNKYCEKWQTRNLKLAHHLANKLDKPIAEISDLMYNITVQNYSQILNPISGFAKKCEVPFASGDACKKLLTIFDSEGNLRHPSDPKSLFQLLQLMQHISRWGSNWEKKQSQIKSILPELRMPLSCAKKNSKTEIIISSNSHRLSSQINYYINSESTSLKKLPKKRSRISVIKSIDKHINLKPRRSLVSHTKSMSFVKKAYKANNSKSITSFYSSKLKKSARDYLFPVQELLLMDDNGRRRGLGIIDLAVLKLKQKYFLRLLLEKNMKDNPDKLLNALIEADLGEPLKETKPEITAAAEISTFYSTVVSNAAERFANAHWQVPKLYHFKKEQMPYSYSVILPFYEPWKLAESMNGIRGIKYHDLMHSHKKNHRTENLN